jgi:endonuclease/exonuclease/phosphatase family metal-dependent hydrolase
MMKRFAFAALFLVGWSVVASAQAEADRELKVMSFNLRFASDKMPNAWSVRRPVTKACIESVKPDLIGTQEGVYAQLKDIENDLGGTYAQIGLGREGGSRGEFMAVFYLKDRFEPLEYDHFWLSDTPNVVASVTWVRFLDKKSKKQFYFWNTHFDHQVQAAREKAAELVRSRIEALNTNLPLILVGDFNATAKNNKAYDTLTAGGFLTDTWKGEEQGTFHNFTGKTPKPNRIDWILTRGGVTADSTEIVKFEQGGQYPSDHYPVVAKVKLPE